MIDDEASTSDKGRKKAVSLFQSIVESLDSLKSARDSLVPELQSITGANGERFDLNKNIPATPNSILEIDFRVESLVELASCIKPDQNDLLFPHSQSAKLKTSIDQITSYYNSITEAIHNIESQGGGVGALDPEAIMLTSSNGSITLKLGSYFENIWSSSDQALSNLYPVINILRADGFGDFSSTHSTFSKIVEVVQDEYTNLVNTTAKARRSAENIENINENANSILNEISRLNSEGEKSRKNLAEYEAEGTEKISAIRQIHENADQVKQTVNSYKSQFENFRNQLDEREKSLKSGTESQQDLLKKLEENETQISDINQRAEKMLSGATVAGLASSFGRLRDDLTHELRYARWVFYFSIVVLFASVIPLLAYVFPSPFVALGLISMSLTQGAGDVSALEFLGQVVTRALLLIPAAWFAKFTAARHAALFRLKEHYAFKYSVASSVDGFKQQAVPYEDEIAAATFFELTFNPADRMEGKGVEERHPNPIMDKVMEKLGFTHDGKEKN